MKIGLIGTGQMGAAIGARLVGEGCSVISPLAGRSTASRARASVAGIEPCGADDLAGTAIILSILPSSAAPDVIGDLRPLLTGVGGPVFIEANALSPDAKRDLLSPLLAAGARVVDASIIGAPPGPGGKGPRIYACGDHAAAVMALRDHGLDIRLIDAPIGAAAALKLSYAALNKGMTALVTASLLMAEASGTLDALLAEWAISQPGLLERSRGSVPSMYPKARRWVSEFEEIAAFATRNHAGGAVFAAIAEFYAARAEAYEMSGEAGRLATALGVSGSEVRST